MKIQNNTVASSSNQPPAAAFEMRSIPPDRAVVVDAGILGAKRHVMYALLEVDVTKALEIKQTMMKKNDNDTISFTAYLAKCLAEAVQSEPRTQGYAVGWRKKQMALFHSVHVSTMIETQKGGVALPHVLRDVEQRSIRDISAEIHRVKTTPHTSDQKNSRFAKAATKVPRWVRMACFRWLMRDPDRIQKNCGTIMLTSVGMCAGKTGFGGGGWGIPHLPLHTTGVTVGGIQTKPAVVNGEIVAREMLNITIGMDHDIVDGAPAARFASRFVELIESASLLEQEQEQEEQLEEAPEA